MGSNKIYIKHNIKEQFDMNWYSNNIIYQRYYIIIQRAEI